MGDLRIMSFENLFDRFPSGRSYSGRSRSADKVSISRGEYEALKVKTKQYEALVDKHKEVKAWNDQLLKEMDDLKDDARNFKIIEEENEKFLKSLLRVRADFENYKRRQEEENLRYRKYVLEEFLRKLTYHYDDLERALNLLTMFKGAEGIRDGFKIIVKNYEKILADEGVRSMGSEGKKFDPYKHEVLLVEEARDDLPENTIIEVLDKGYWLGEKVLRPAKVKISKRSKKIEEKIEVI
ncbi:MAG: Protein GrpE [Candidatus Lokiarchaeum sp. GC14_75]|nr:MAG: Protein GrpE [Candidatus Lokiarchaeum sp. GC14_75]